MKKYKDALLSPDISWDLVTQGIKIPLNLYKYQSFVTEKGDENLYWSANMNGQFHMSLGCEFEDINDCKPFFNKAAILKYFDNLFKSLNMNLEQKDEMLNEIDDALTEEYFIQVIKIIKMTFESDALQMIPTMKKCGINMLRKRRDIV